MEQRIWMWVHSRVMLLLLFYYIFFVGGMDYFSPFRWSWKFADLMSKVRNKICVEVSDTMIGLKCHGIVHNSRDGHVNNLGN